MAGIVVLAGPTAVGKTATTTRLAARFPLEVISLDSRQIYHGLRIGTAQPTADELAICPHHLVDFLSPAETYSAQRFREDFERVHAEIVGRGGVPILVGGAGMYLTALRDGFLRLPEHDPAELIRVRSRLDALELSEVQERLARVDAESRARIHSNDRYRLQRALEIHLLTGRTMTELMAEQKPDPSLGLDFRTVILARDTRELDERIARRTEVMLAEGWIDETRTALALFPGDSPGLASLGYRQIVPFLQGTLARAELAPAIVLETRQYAKRQRTWFRKTRANFCGHPADPSLADRIVELVDNTYF